MQENQNTRMLLLLSGYAGTIYRPHLHTPQPLALQLLNRNFASGHLQQSSHRDQTWAAAFQKLEVGYNGGTRFKCDLALQAGSGLG